MGKTADKPALKDVNDQFQAVRLQCCQPSTLMSIQPMDESQNNRDQDAYGVERSVQ